MLSRRGLITAATAAGLPIIPGHAASPQVLRIGMTAADLPTTHGIPNNGGEGFRFLGYPAYDALVNWDFSHTDVLADVTPGLFSAYHADDVIWNFRRVYDDKSPQYDAPAAPIVRATLSMIESFEKADDKTIILTT